MNAHLFGLHNGHLNAKIDQLTKRHGVEHINHTDPFTGGRTGWFECESQGWIMNGKKEKEVMDAIDTAGGIDAFRKRP